MRIEHFAINVPEPVAMAAWYEEHLGMKTVRKAGLPTHMHFLADDSGQTIVEIYNNAKAPVPDYRTMPALVLHLAFAVENVNVTRERLLKAGASADDEITVTPLGDEMVMLRDPWGVALQFVKRREPILKP
jgi:glyoxylase I family protein